MMVKRAVGQHAKFSDILAISETDIKYKTLHQKEDSLGSAVSLALIAIFRPKSPAPLW